MEDKNMCRGVRQQTGKCQEGDVLKQVCEEIHGQEIGECIFCKTLLVTQNLSLLKNCYLLNNLQTENFRNEAFIEKHFKNVLTGALKIPEAKFYNQGQSKNIPDPDLVLDEHLEAHHSTIRRRQTEMDEEMVAQRFLKWSLNKKRFPALVLSGNKFQDHLSGSHDVYSFLKINNLLGEYDVMCLTKDYGLLVCEVKSVFDGSRRLKEDAEKAWRQANKDAFVFKALNADLDCITDIPIHIFVAFPNLKRDIHTDIFCSKHMEICMFEDEFKSQSSFDAFLENHMRTKTFGPNSTLTEPSYKLLTSRYISISSKMKSPRTVSEISKIACQKISKSGSEEKYLTPEQKEIIDKFSYTKNMFTKLKINGKFGCGKTLILSQGVRKLYQTLTQECPKVKHIILVSSFGCIDLAGWPRYFEEENFLVALKEDLADIIQKNKSNTSVKIGSLLDEIMDDLGIYIRCDECLSKHIDCHHDEAMRKKIASMAIPCSLNFRVLDLLRIFQKASEKYKVPIDNIHLFLDEVHGIAEDWTLLDAFSRKYKNVIWLAMHSEYYLENHHEIHLPSFTEKYLSFVLRNTMSLSRLNDSIEGIFRSMTGRNERQFQIMHEELERGSKKFTNRKPITEIPKKELLKNGHLVEGVIPRLLIIKQCFCKSAVKIDKSQTLLLQFHSGNFCKCSSIRIEEVLQMSISTMFDLQHVDNLVGICRNLDSDVHIILNMQEIDFWASIFRNNKIPHSILSRTRSKQFYFSKKAEDCKIHLVNKEGVLGQEFNNVIYVASNVHLGLSNTKTGDIFDCSLLQCISRAKTQLHIITYNGLDMSRFWDCHKRMRICNARIHKNIGDLERFHREEKLTAYFSYRFETLGLFLFPHLLQEGLLTFLPCKQQTTYGLAEVTNLLQTGRNLFDKANHIFSEGEKFYKETMYREAFLLYQEAATILLTRIGSRALSGVSLMAGVRSWLMLNNQYSDPFKDEYIENCEDEEIRQYLQKLKILDRCLSQRIASSLFCLRKIEGALIMFEISQNEENPEADLGLANCYFNLGQRDVAATLYSGILEDGRKEDKMSAMVHLINCEASPGTNPFEPYSGEYFRHVLSLDIFDFRRVCLFKRLIPLYPRISQKYDCARYNDIILDYSAKIGVIDSLKTEFDMKNTILETGFDEKDLLYLNKK